MFQPGVLNGDLNPQILLRPKPYKGDFVNPAPNVGMAWNPEKPDGLLGTLLGDAVFRANFGINYYDEGSSLSRPQTVTVRACSRRSRFRRSRRAR